MAGVSGTIKIEAKEQKSGFLSMLLNILGAGLLGNLLTDKWAKAKIPGPGAIRADEEVTRVDQDF